MVNWISNALVSKWKWWKDKRFGKYYWKNLKINKNQLLVDLGIQLILYMFIFLSVFFCWLQSARTSEIFNQRRRKKEKSIDFWWILLALLVNALTNDHRHSTIKNKPTVTDFHHKSHIQLYIFTINCWQCFCNAYVYRKKIERKLNLSTLFTAAMIFSFFIALIRKLKI